jgi:hypothetical protein
MDIVVRNGILQDFYTNVRTSKCDIDLPSTQDNLQSGTTQIQHVVDLTILIERMSE